MYDTLCRDIVSSAVAGTNATIMAYGQVGAQQLPCLHWMSTCLDCACGRGDAGPTAPRVVLILSTCI